MLHYLDRHLPDDWANSSTHLYDTDYETTNISVHSSDYYAIEVKVAGSFNRGVQKIVRVENPFLYGSFLLKKAEYESRGFSNVMELYHDTGASKVDSILRTNLDWRRANRVKFGQGVSFSPSPEYANRESSRNNGTDRAMIVADVLVGRTFDSSSDDRIPPDDCNTGVGNRQQVYVKFDDNEFYPKYVVYYTSIERVYRRRAYWGMW